MALDQRNADLGAGLVDGAQAWDEWKKNCLALHAEAYPDVWYGIWSGPDTYNSVLSRYPGQTMFWRPSPEDQTAGCIWVSTGRIIR